ncbi:HD domain-containing protein [Cellulomonas sp. URHE0023]|uniref:HD domain-containing protein n=1 Tax=Cellulomonas sp. URHE0023 TaxID=1380354 RepID=UPI000481AA70|nr:HD domain-containing protein [Cellulomonas sp. URHE0023]
MTGSVFDLDAAVRLATTAHEGQTDKGGEAYIGHPLRVMARVEGDDARMVAVLHDVLEDTPVTAADLLALGCPAAVVAAVDALSKRPGETLDESMRRVAEHPLAVVVKHADLDDNTDPERVSALPPHVAHRLGDKYRRSRELLESLTRAAP